jgi:hypothetical protein
MTTSPRRGIPHRHKERIMTLSLYSTYKAMRRDVAVEKTRPVEAADNPIQNSVRHALALLGMGVEGVSCGGDITASRR